MENRIKNLREKRGLIQELLAAELGITQQMLSKYERDSSIIKVDVEYSCAVTPQVRQTGNRLSGLAGTAYASLLT